MSGFRDCGVGHYWARPESPASANQAEGCGQHSPAAVLVTPTPFLSMLKVTCFDEVAPLATRPPVGMSESSACRLAVRLEAAAFGR